MILRKNIYRLNKYFKDFSLVFTMKLLINAQDSLLNSQIIVKIVIKILGFKTPELNYIIHF